MRKAYHGTTLQSLPPLLADGLVPQAQQHGDEDRCIPASDEALFFCPRPEWAHQWGPVVVSFPWPADAEKDGYGDGIWVDGGLLYTNWFSRLPVPAIDVQVEEVAR